MRGVREEVCAEQQPAASRADAHRREALRMRRAGLRQDLLRRLRTQVSLALILQAAVQGDAEEL